MNKYIELTAGEKIHSNKLVYIDGMGRVKESKSVHWAKRINHKPLVIGVSMNDTPKGAKVTLLIYGRLGGEHEKQV